MTLKQAPEEAVPKIKAILAQGQCCRLQITGTSMVPFLRHEKDAVILRPFDAQVKRGQLLFYERPGGQCVLHRVHHVRGSSYLLCGDNQTALEPVKSDQVIGAIAAIERSGRQFSPNHLLWRFLSGLWFVLFPLRPWLLRLMHWLHRRIKG